MNKRSGLGRGLDALIGLTPEETAAGSGLLFVPVSVISPNPHQPRAAINETKLAELADSIRQHGLIQPLIVRRQEDGGYALIAGERRWRAAQLAGLPEVPVIVKEATPQDMLELALVENVQRADLNPLEEASAYQQLVEEFGLTHEEVARRVGKSRPTITNTIRLLELPESVRAAVIEERISGSHARALLPLPTAEKQMAVMAAIIKNGLSVRQVEAIVAKLIAGERPKARPPATPSAELAELESQFRQSLGTQVKIQQGPKGGKVIIHFYSDEELQAIYEVIVGREEGERG